MVSRWLLIAIYVSAWFKWSRVERGSHAGAGHVKYLHFVVICVTRCIYNKSAKLKRHDRKSFHNLKRKGISWFRGRGEIRDACCCIQVVLQNISPFFPPFRQILMGFQIQRWQFSRSKNLLHQSTSSSCIKSFFFLVISDGELFSFLDERNRIELERNDVSFFFFFFFFFALAYIASKIKTIFFFGTSKLARIITQQRIVYATRDETRWDTLVALVRWRQTSVGGMAMAVPVL